MRDEIFEIVELGGDRVLGITSFEMTKIEING